MNKKRIYKYVGLSILVVVSVFSVSYVVAVTMGGNLNLGGFKIINMATPIDSPDGATKGYVDAQAGGGGGNRFFTTRTKYTGNLGGLAGANAKCATEIAGARFSGCNTAGGYYNLNLTIAVAVQYATFWCDVAGLDGGGIPENNRDCVGWTSDLNWRTGPQGRYYYPGIAPTPDANMPMTSWMGGFSPCNVPVPLLCVY